jgi:hypothetical protein
VTFRSRFVTFACVVAAVLGVYACSTGTTTGITPITGIVVRADTLVAGHGCGTGPDQIYKYAAVVSLKEEAGTSPLVAAGAYDCYADATFVNLCSSSTGAFVYDVDVYAFTQAQWNAVSAQIAQALPPPPPQLGQPTDLPTVLAALSSYCTTDGGFALETQVTNALAAGASLSTTCTATQQSNIEVLAVCAPLAAAP